MEQNKIREANTMKPISKVKAVDELAVVARFPRYRYVCEKHGEIGRDGATSWGIATITYDSYAPGEMRCQKCYWENVIVPNCGLVTKEEVK